MAHSTNSSIYTYDPVLNKTGQLDLTFYRIDQGYKFLMSCGKELIVIGCKDIHVFDDNELISFKKSE